MKKHSKKKKGLKPPQGFDSWFEHELATGPLKAAEFHPAGVPYVQKKTYYPDFHKRIAGIDYYFEAKGRFRDRQEARKYVDVVQGFGQTEKLVFIFQNPSTPMPASRRREDGTRLTMAQWAEKNGFEYYCPSSIPKQYKA
jgi:hypothetical protein